MKKLLILIALTKILIISSIATFATERNTESIFKQPKPNEVINHLQQSNEVFLPRILKISNWNIQKSNNVHNINELLSVLNDHHLNLIQEATDEKKFITRLISQNNLNINYAASFYLSQNIITTGVMTMSSARPAGVHYRRSPGRETFIHTPKMTLIEEYLFTENDRLLVLNIHGLNFVSDQTFKDQINDLTPLLKSYPNRILFAGDFNTWNTHRLNWLVIRLKEYGLEQIKITNDQRLLKLDHLFIRGCQIIDSKILKQFSTSDHYPLTAHIDCSNSNP